MDEVQLYPAIIFTSLFLLWSITKYLQIYRKQPGERTNLPPSPPKLPLIGNLHLLVSPRSPHRIFHRLALKHGPIMLLHLGRRPTVIVSSAHVAREIMKTHDATFATRPQYGVIKKFTYDCKEVPFAPYGEHWRQSKSILVVHLLNSKKVKSFRSIREQETEILMKRVLLESSSSPGDHGHAAINLSQMLFKFTSDVVYRSVYGRKYSESLFKIVKQGLALLDDVSIIGEFLPSLGWIGRVNGFDKKVDKIAKQMDDFLEGVIEERMKNPKGQVERDENGEDFVDILLAIHNNNDKKTTSSDRDVFDRNSVKALMLDAYAGGADNTYTVLEWAMSELLRHPPVMEKLQKEVRQVFKDKHDIIITEDELEKMQYLKAVIKETLRCYPPSPLLVPRAAQEDVKINGYDVPAGTTVIVNSWAISRDPTYWEEPEKFKPERFLNSSVDFNSQDFEFIPFGAGRRSCPGGTFAMVIIELVLANIVHKFNWELPDGAQGKDLDMSEGPGVLLQRAVPLLVVATQPK